jgi:hypothetical protein
MKKILSQLKQFQEFEFLTIGNDMLLNKPIEVKIVKIQFFKRNGRVVIVLLLFMQTNFHFQRLSDMLTNTNLLC